MHFTIEIHCIVNVWLMYNYDSCANISSLECVRPVSAIFIRGGGGYNHTWPLWRGPATENCIASLKFNTKPHHRSHFVLSQYSCSPHKSHSFCANLFPFYEKDKCVYYVHALCFQGIGKSSTSNHWGSPPPPPPPVQRSLPTPSTIISG